ISVWPVLRGALRSQVTPRAATRGRIVAELSCLIDEDPQRACFVVEIEHLALLNARYGVDAVDQLCDYAEDRLRGVDPSVEMLGRPGPATFAGSIRIAGSSAGEAAQSV